MCVMDLQGHVLMLVGQVKTIFLYDRFEPCKVRKAENKETNADKDRYITFQDTELILCTNMSSIWLMDLDNLSNYTLVMIGILYLN